MSVAHNMNRVFEHEMTYALRLLRDADAKSRILLSELVVSAVKLGITSEYLRIFGRFARLTDRN